MVSCGLHPGLPSLPHLPVANHGIRACNHMHVVHLDEPVETVQASRKESLQTFGWFPIFTTAEM